MKKKNLKKIVNEIANDSVVRRRITKESHLWFTLVFLSDHFIYPLAPFHKEILKLTEQNEYKLIEVMAFRGSGKSTFLSLSYPLWAILGKQQKKCVLIISKTQNQAKNHFLNLKSELEYNNLLKRDLGPFKVKDAEWGQLSLVIPLLGARIYAISKEQSIRGIRHDSKRPDLIICDDIEDTLSDSQETYEDTYRWFTNEVILSGDTDSRIVVIGNLTHEHSLMLRLKKDIENKKLNGIFKAYPFWDDNGTILWPGKFGNKSKITELRQLITEESIWNTEYLLTIDSSPNMRDLADNVMGGKRKAPTKPCPNPQTMENYKINSPKIYDSAYYSSVIRSILDEERERILKREPR